jgi:hypothetical protein
MIHHTNVPKNKPTQKAPYTGRSEKERGGREREVSGDRREEKSERKRKRE